MLQNLQAIILAGGISERFQTGKTKFLEKICGTEMILYPIDLLHALHLSTTVVVGSQADKIKKIVTSKYPQVDFVVQDQPLGSGHAAQLTKPVWQRNHILIMNGDIPLISPDIINKLYRKHTKMDADISFITAHAIDVDNSQHSRLIIDNNQMKVMEEPTEAAAESSQCCISAGIYLAKRSFLEQHISKITQNTSTNEYYLPELIQIASQNSCKIVTTQVSLDVVRSVETLADLWAVEHIKRSELLQHWMDHGVRFANTLTTQLDLTVRIQPGSYIHPGVLLIGDTTIKKNALIGAYSRIENSIIEEDVNIPPYTVISNSIITKSMVLKPFTTIEGLSPKSKKDIVFTGAFKAGTPDQHNF